MSEKFFGMDDLGIDDVLLRGEEEGITELASTRQAKIVSITKEIDRFRRKNPNKDIDDQIDEIIESHDIDIDSLTPDERRIIDRHL